MRPLGLSVNGPTRAGNTGPTSGRVRRMLRYFPNRHVQNIRSAMPARSRCTAQRRAPYGQRALHRSPRDRRIDRAPRSARNARHPRRGQRERWHAGGRRAGRPGAPAGRVDGQLPAHPGGGLLRGFGDLELASARSRGAVARMRRVPVPDIGGRSRAPSGVESPKAESLSPERGAHRAGRFSRSGRGFEGP
jgi:hypothetical protein